MFSAIIKKNWPRWHALAMLAMGGLAPTLGLAPFLVVTVFSFFLLLTAHHEQLKPQGFIGGAANQISILRLVCIIAVAMAQPDLRPLFTFFAIVLALCLDGLDGYIARKLGLLSDFGGQLDQEIDGVFVLLWGIVLHVHLDVGTWILLPGLVKYAYPFLLALVVKSPRAEPGLFWKKVVAVAIFAALCSPHILPMAIAQYLLILCSAAVVFSFAHSFWWQVRAQRQRNIEA